MAFFQQYYHSFDIKCTIDWRVTNSNAFFLLIFQISTYALFVEDVIEVLPDMVIVHEAAASHIQRLTKVILLQNETFNHPLCNFHKNSWCNP